MAYTIPVAAFIIDMKAAAGLINEPPDFFDHENNDRWGGVERLQKVVGHDIEIFATEDGSVFYMGIRILEDWRIDIDGRLMNRAATIRSRFKHPLLLEAPVAVVSEFC